MLRRKVEFLRLEVLLEKGKVFLCLITCYVFQYFFLSFFLLLLLFSFHFIFFENFLYLKESVHITCVDRCI